MWEGACPRWWPDCRLGCWGFDRVHIRYLGNGRYGFRPYGGSLLNSAKVSKTLLPHHSAPRLGSVCLRSRSKTQRGGLIADLIDAACAYPCGSGLARESGGSVNLNVCWADAFASKPAPTFYLRCVEHFVRLTDRLPQKSRSAASVSTMRSEPLLILISGAPLNHAGRTQA